MLASSLLRKAIVTCLVLLDGSSLRHDSKDGMQRTSWGRDVGEKREFPQQWTTTQQ